MATLEHQNFSNFFQWSADHGKNESNKSDFNEALEHNLEGKTSEKDRVLPKKSTLLVVFADLRKNSKLDGEFFSQVSKTTNKVLNCLSLV